MSWKNIVIVIIICMIIIPYGTIEAISTDEIIIDNVNTSYYDDQPKVWGDYIIWRRLHKTYDSTSVGWFEPSWIMVHKISTGETYNITPIDKYLYTDGSSNQIYTQARAISIWKNYVIYEKQYYTNSAAVSSTFRTYMYNLYEDTETQIYLPYTSWTAGQLTSIYGDWILYSHYGSTYRTGYLLNRITNESFILNNGAINGIVTASLSDNYLVYTLRTSTNIDSINIRNLETGKTIILSATDIAVTYNLITTSCYNNYVSINILETIPSSSWNLYIWDITHIDWINDTSFFWNDILDYLIPVSNDFTYNVRGSIIYSTNVCFGKERLISGLVTYDIYVFNIISNKTTLITNYESYKHSSYMYETIVVWTDNRLDSTPLYNVKDFTSIYRTSSLSEEIPRVFYNLMPIFMLGGVIFIASLAVKAITDRF